MSTAAQAPAWYEFPDDPYRSDFRNFLALVWEFLGLPEPTYEQYEAAWFLQWGYAGYVERNDGTFCRFDELLDGEEHRGPLGTFGTSRNDIFEGFRGLGKSYLAAAFVLWKLLRDPVDEKILVVSATTVKAKEFVAQCKAILMGLPLLSHLRPRSDQRDQADRFDVNGASISQSPSLKAAGITGQVTGSRATTIVADDIEIPGNSKTEEARKTLLRNASEFDAIVVPDRPVLILMLGTPQTEESIYNVFIKERGFHCYCWPARFPRPEKRASYVLKREDGSAHDILAPPLRAVDKNKRLAEQPTAPQRFPEAELARREAKGRSFFALQFMLDTSLSDAERYPLKAHDLIVMAVNTMKAPITVQWGRHTDRKNLLRDIPNFGFSGDYVMGPLFLDDEWREYTGSVLYVDPSGRGKDETGWAVAKALNGLIFVPEVSGLSGDPAAAMEAIAHCAKRHNVSKIVIEPNYAGAVWLAAFQPVLARVWPGGCTVVEGEWAKGMKEGRIIDTLEPVMTQHRLVVDESVARDEKLMYQLTHIAAVRNCLTHEDRLDALAGAVAEFTRDLMMDTKQAARAVIEAELEAELADFIETATEHGGLRRGRSRRKADGYRAEVYSTTH